MQVMNFFQYTSNKLLSKLENVDAVLDGHTHLIYNTTTKDKNNKDIHISQTGTKLQSIGKLIIKNDGTITSEIIEDPPEPSNKTNAIKINRGNKDRWVDKDMNAFLNKKFKDYEEELNIQFGHIDYDLTIMLDDDTGSKINCCRFQECPAGNLLADAYKYSGNSEIGIVNGGGVRSGLKAGNLTRAQIMEVAPFFNNLVVKQLPGQCILDVLEHATAKCPAPGSFPQVSGLTFDLDIGFNSSVITDPQGLFLNITGKRRVYNVKINGEDLILDKLYSVSLNEYMANGGSGYTMLSKYDVYNESLLTDTDSLAYYIRDKLKGEIPASYKDFQGRANIFNSSEVIFTIPSTTTLSTSIIIPTSTLPRNVSDFYIFRQRKSSGGLSTGGIIAIIIALSIVLIVASIISLMCHKRNIANPQMINDLNLMISTTNLNNP